MEHELFSAYEIANKIVEQGSATYKEAGEERVFQLAWNYSNAENERRNTERNCALTEKVSVPGLSETRERAKSKAFSACDEFTKEYDAFRARRAALGRRVKS